MGDVGKSHARVMILLTIGPAVQDHCKRALVIREFNFCTPTPDRDAACFLSLNRWQLVVGLRLTKDHRGYTLTLYDWFEFPFLMIDSTKLCLETI